MDWRRKSGKARAVEKAERGEESGAGAPGLHGMYRAHKDKHFTRALKLKLKQLSPRVFS
jgi:hypothetical protein